MKANTTENLKFVKLQRRLKESRRGIVGLLELLWTATAKQCPRGDIGKFDNEGIAILCDWEGDPDELVTALVSTGWLDQHPTHRLVVHDWHEHAPNYVKAALLKRKEDFATIHPRGILDGSPEASPDVSPERSPEASPEGSPVPSSRTQILTKSSQVKSSLGREREHPPTIPDVLKTEEFSLEWSKWERYLPTAVDNPRKLPGMLQAHIEELYKAVALSGRSVSDAIEALSLARSVGSKRPCWENYQKRPQKQAVTSETPITLEYIFGENAHD